MKFYILIPFVLLLLLVTSCGEAPNPDKENMIVSSEVFTSKLGNKEVYGVQLRLSADQRQFLQYAIELKINEQVWLDTIDIEVPATDTLESEIIFSESQVNRNDLIELNIKASRLER